jgi:hypothetical protein
MPPMTRAQGHANWAGNPSLSQLWLGSTLRTLAMLVSIVARLFSPKHQTQTAECDGVSVQTPEANDVLDQFRRTTATAAAVVGVIAVVGVAATRSAPTDLSAEAHRAQAEGLTLRTIAQAIVDSKGFAAVREADDLVQWTKSSSGRGASNPLNGSSSGMSRGSRLGQRREPHEAHRCANRDSRDALRLPGNDPLWGLWANSVAAPA